MDFSHRGACGILSAPGCGRARSMTIDDHFLSPGSTVTPAYRLSCVCLPFRPSDYEVLIRVIYALRNRCRRLTLGNPGYVKHPGEICRRGRAPMKWWKKTLLSSLPLALLLTAATRFIYHTGASTHIGSACTKLARSALKRGVPRSRPRMLAQQPARGERSLRSSNPIATGSHRGGGLHWSRR